jgi:hypothetical protein
MEEKGGVQIVADSNKVDSESTASLLVNSKLQRKVHGLLLCTLNQNFWWLDLLSLHFCMSIMQPFYSTEFKNSHQRAPLAVKIEVIAALKK